MRRGSPSAASTSWRAARAQIVLTRWSGDRLVEAHAKNAFMTRPPATGPGIGGGAGSRLLGAPLAFAFDAADPGSVFIPERGQGRRAQGRPPGRQCRALAVAGGRAEVRPPDALLVTMAVCRGAVDEPPRAVVVQILYATRELHPSASGKSACLSRGDVAFGTILGSVYGNRIPAGWDRGRA